MKMNVKQKKCVLLLSKITISSRFGCSRVKISLLFHKCAIHGNFTSLPTLLSPTRQQPLVFLDSAADVFNYKRNISYTNIINVISENNPSHLVDGTSFITISQNVDAS